MPDRSFPLETATPDLVEPEPNLIHRFGIGTPLRQMTSQWCFFIQLPQIAEIFSKPTGNDELADMRAAMAKETHARIILGGRVTKVSKGISGIAAEALATLANAKPLLVVGGIGGASRDVAGALGLVDEAELVERDDSVYRDNHDQPSKDLYWAHMGKLRGFAADYQSMLEKKALLDDAKQLAISESHAEIGTLVVTMLSKLLGP